MSCCNWTHHGPEQILIYVKMQDMPEKFGKLSQLRQKSDCNGQVGVQLMKHITRPGVGFGWGRECPNLAGAGNWPFWDLAGAGAVNFINPWCKFRI